MLSLVTKDREKLSQRLATEIEMRKRLEGEKRELERKLRLGSATSQVETRKGKDLAESLTRKKEELAGMRAALSAQTMEINRLQSEHAPKDKRLAELEKKLSAYDDSFYSLEARNVRDRTRMEEMGKAKTKAEEERSVYRLMLEQAHERALKERQDLRREAQSKLEASANRGRARKARIAALEKELREKSQVEEEKNAYREQCSVLMEQCSSLMEQLRAAHGMDTELPAPSSSSRPSKGSAAASAGFASPGGSGSFLDRVRSGVKQGMAAARDATANPQERPPPPPPPPPPPNVE